MEPLHLPTMPPMGGQSPSVQQAALVMQLPLQSLVPVLQVYWQAPVMVLQAAVFPVCAGQSALEQQPGLHRSPHRLPPGQMKSHLVPSQVGVLLGGPLQGVQDVGPQELTLVLSPQTPLQLWVPAGQAPEHV